MIRFAVDKRNETIYSYEKIGGSIVETKRVHIPDMDKDLHKRLKVAAAQLGIPIKEWVKKAIVEKLKRDEKNPWY